MKTSNKRKSLLNKSHGRKRSRLASKLNGRVLELNFACKLTTVIGLEASCQETRDLNCVVLDYTVMTEEFNELMFEDIWMDLEVFKLPLPLPTVNSPLGKRHEAPGGVIINWERNTIWSERSTMKNFRLTTLHVELRHE